MGNAAGDADASTTTQALGDAIYFPHGKSVRVRGGEREVEDIR